MTQDEMELVAARASDFGVCWPPPGLQAETVTLVDSTTARLARAEERIAHLEERIAALGLVLTRECAGLRDTIKRHDERRAR